MKISSVSGSGDHYLRKKKQKKQFAQSSKRSSRSYLALGKTPRLYRWRKKERTEVNEGQGKKSRFQMNWSE